MTSRAVFFLSRIAPFHGSGGMQAVSWDIARELARRGNRVTFLTTEVRGQPPRFERDGVELVALPGTKSGKYSAGWWRASRNYVLAQPAASVAAVLSVSAGGYGLLAVRDRLPGTRFVMQAHGTSMGEIASKWRAGRPKDLIGSARNMWWLVRDLASYSRFDAVVAVGESVCESLRRPPISWFLSEGRVTLVPNGVDTTRFSPDPALGRAVRERLGWTPDLNVVVSASRLHEQKGVRQALHGFAELAATDPLARYLVIGGGPREGELRSLANELGLAGKTAFVGEATREKVADFLRAGDVFLFTTLWREGLPLNVLEASAVGLPLVVSSSLLPIARECGPAMGVDPHSPATIARALRELMASPRPARGTQQARLPDRYTLACCAARYDAILSARDEPGPAPARS